jgi:acetyl-CoA C-acetyltransferase
MVIMSRSKAEQLKLEVLGVIEACECAAGDPKYMACVPAQAITRLLAKTGRVIDEIDLFEINEAFAAVTLVSLKLIADGNPVTFETLKQKTNVNGGAIAIGHPVGASGARITMTLMYELKRRGGGVGVAAICGGLSQGEALILTV